MFQECPDWKGQHHNHAAKKNEFPHTQMIQKACASWKSAPPITQPFCELISLLDKMMLRFKRFKGLVLRSGPNKSLVYHTSYYIFKNLLFCEDYNLFVDQFIQQCHRLPGCVMSGLFNWKQNRPCQEHVQACKCRCRVCPDWHHLPLTL